MRKSQALYFASGLLLLLAYWYSVHPMDFARGYTEDWCHPDITRQLMSEAIARAGGPDFTTPAYMAPYGMKVPFMSWGIEISWLGSYFWKWARDFPFLWVHFGVSLVLSYAGVGWILGRMGLTPRAAWGLSLLAVLVNVPRHFKIWHHYEHLLQHWVYWSLFLDAWIWQRFWRQRRWSWSLEAWRGLCLLGMMTTAGYFWGALILEWLLMRLSMAGFWLGWRYWRKAPIRVQGSVWAALPAAVLGLAWVALELRWFMPLAGAARELGAVPTALGWFGHWPYLIRPLWMDAFARKPFASFETVITVGWIFWIPAVAGFVALWRKRGWRSALGAVFPFLLLLAIAVDYFNSDPPRLAIWIQRWVPFMEFFRVATRWGLLLPALLGVWIALCWPELREGLRGGFSRRRGVAYAFAGLFVVSSGFEASYLRKPVTTMPQLSASAASLLEGVRTSSGTTVLDLPFCLAGGNGVCTEQMCPNYPYSTTGGCFRGWHDKAVYGIYASRLVPSQCVSYQQAPYSSWFDAWRTQRCFADNEWEEFCSYLERHPELSAVLLYPDIWYGAGDPGCLAEFERRLGPALDRAEFVVEPVRGPEAPRWTRLMRFGTRCLSR